MSAPRPPEPSVPLDQIFSPGVIKLIWTGEILLVLALMAGFGMLAFRIGFQILQMIRGHEKIRWFPTAVPDRGLTYCVPVVFNEYVNQRDGWRGHLPIIKQLIILSAFGVAFTSIMKMSPPTIDSFCIAFFGFGLIFYSLKFFSESHDSPISFYPDGIGNRPKGQKTPYSFYEKAVLDSAQFGDIRFKVIKFVPKRKVWLKMKDEYGFAAEVDLAPLISLGLIPRRLRRAVG